MSRSYIDREIAEVFRAEVEDITVSDSVKRNIDEILFEKEFKGGKVVKLFSKKRMLVLGAACIILSASVVFAGGQVTSLVSRSNLFAVCKDYSKLSKQEEKLGYSVEIVEQFSNGYIFESMEVGKVKGLDEAGNIVETYKELDVDYKNELGEKVSLNADQRNAGRDFRTPVQILECGETTFYYYLDTYKFVPVDYELTEEDRKNMEREDYEISTGSDEVEINMMSSVEWERNNVRYNLLAIDTEMTADEMLEMASEIIK